MSALIVNLIARHSSLALDVVSASRDLGVRVQQYMLHGEANQRWVIEDLRDGTFFVKDANSGLVMDVIGASTEDGAPVHMWEWHGGANQRWRVEVDDLGAWFTNVNSGKVLDVAGGEGAPGALLQQWTNHGGLNQRFQGVFPVNTNHADLRVPAPPPPPPPPEPASHPDPVGQIRAWGFPDVSAFQISFAWYDISVDGGVGPQTARAVQVVVNNGGRLSPNFHLNEFRSKGNGQVKTHRHLVRGLEKVREQVGSVSIISGYRDPQHNQNVGGARNSQHMYATAADVRLPFNVVRGLNHFSGIGCIGRAGGQVAHVDVRADGPNNTTGGRPDNPTIWIYPTG